MVGLRIMRITNAVETEGLILKILRCSGHRTTDYALKRDVNTRRNELGVADFIIDRIRSKHAGMSACQPDWG